MANSTSPRKRPKPETPSLGRPRSLHPSSSSSSNSSFPMEPPPHFFPSKDDSVRLLAVVVVAALVVASCNFAVTFLNRQPKPFCDSDAVFDDSFSDSCVPCPQHGFCHHGILECLRGYIKYGRLCVEDSNVNVKAKELSNFVETHVCEAYAQHLCYAMDTVWVHEADIWNALNELKFMEDNGLDKTFYMYAKERAVEIADQILEKRTTILGTKQFKCPELLVEKYKPFSCIIRQWIAKHASVLVSVLTLFVGCIFFLNKFRKRRKLSIRAEQLYKEVCDILEENALTARGINVGSDPWIVASWLRDHLLSPKERKDPLLWKKVEELVQGDSRLVRYPRMVKGEAKVVWEWQVEGSLSSSGKQKRCDKRKFFSRGKVNSSAMAQPQALEAGAPLC